MNSKPQNKKQEEQKIPVLNSIFGENSKGESGLRVFVDNWKHNSSWDASDYVRATSMATFVGGVVGAFSGFIVSAANTDEPIDNTLNQENISIINTNPTGYAAIKTKDGPQLYKIYPDMKTMILIKDQNKAKDISDEAIKHFEEAKSSSICSALSGPVIADNITVLLNNGNETAIRDIRGRGLKFQYTYNLESYYQNQITFWSDISSDIENGQYNVPDMETLPISKEEAGTQAIKSPYSFLSGAFIANAFLYGFFGVRPNVKRTIEQVSRPGWGTRKNPDSQEPESYDL